MNLSKDEWLQIVWGEHPDWDTVVDEIIGHGRWSVSHQGIFQHKPTGKFYRLNWAVAATEYQDEQPFRYDEPNPVEVVKKEVMAYEWVEV